MQNELIAEEYIYCQFIDPIENVKSNKNNKKCEHGKEKYHCKECGGSGICEHGKRKSDCKECGGSAFCEHGKQKSQCKECDKQFLFGKTMETNRYSNY